MEVSINRHLNLVIPLDRADGTTVYVHSTPIRRETFETYYMVLARTWSACAQNGLDPRSAPSVAGLLLQDVAKSTQRGAGGLTWWDGPDGVGGERGLLAEVQRLTNVVVPGTTGWAATPLEIAKAQELIDAEDLKEVISLLTFFTVASWMAPRNDRGTVIRGMASIYDLQVTSSNCTEYAASLKTSTPGASIGESVKAS